MATTLPTLNALWRTTSVDDREKVRQYASAPASGVVLHSLTVALNLMAEASPAAVQEVQKWIDEIEDLEATWSDRVASGSAHVGAAQEYEGPIPGVTLTKDDTMRRADVIEWDTDLKKIRISGGGAGGTEAAIIGGRIEGLKHRVLVAVGWDGVSGGARLVRS